jgi:hypothetical protein
MKQYCLGKGAARPNAIKLKFGAIFKATALPTPPISFGVQPSDQDWGMLANDSVGDCVLAGGDHETMVLIKDGSGATVSFTDTNALADYSAITGYVPGNPDTDQGTDMQVAADYRRKTGLIDASGQRHLIAAYLELMPSNVDEIALASYLMGVAGFGMQFPSSAEDQFSAGQPWTVVPGDTIEGGHYVPIVGRTPSGNLVCVTWGRTQEITPEFYQQYNDESIAYVSQEFLLSNGLSPEGFDLAALEAFLGELPSAA